MRRDSTDMSRALLRPALLLAISGAAACSTTGPVSYSPLTVTLSGPSTVAGHDTTVGGVASYVCYYRLTATAQGGAPSDYATWGTGHFTYLGQNSATYSGTYPSAAALFGPYTTVPAGAQVSNAQTNVWTQPFQFTMVLYYVTLDSTATDSASYSFTCQ
jgi:hypothetical protein